MTPSPTLARKVAQLFCLEMPTSSPDEAVADLLEHHWGGYIFDCRRDARSMLEALRAVSLPAPLLMAADLERGAGQHLAEGTRFPHAMAFGATGDPTLAHALGRHTAQEALCAGINWVLAPVADVTSNPDNPIINIRSFGSDPERVADMVAAFVAGCQEAGAIACVKHFPGHGDTAEDSHSLLARATANRERMEGLEWVPFKRAIAAGVGSVMTAHLAAPALDPSGVPATLSAPIVTGVLRTELRFDGLIVTDALNMGGITKGYDPEAAAIAALKAGCDVLLMPPRPLDTLRAIIRAVETGELAAERIDEAYERVLVAKRRVKPPSVPTGDAAALAEQVAVSALTWLRRPAEPPRDLSRMASLILDDDEAPEAYAPWVVAHEERGLAAPRAVPVTAATGMTDDLLRTLTTRQPVLVAVFSTVKAWKERINLAPEHVALLTRLDEVGHPLVIVCFSGPYAADQAPSGAWFLGAFSDHPASQRAALRAIAGESPPSFPPAP